MSKRIESKTSRTAEMTCLSRAASYFENREMYKSGDYIATIVMPSFMKYFFKIGFTRKFFMDRVAPKGMYQYVIARTKYIDEQFANALKDGFEQIVIFGAGFDSRGIRLYDSSKGIKVFELDVPITQKAKIDRYKETGIAVPPNLVFVPIDFEKQSIKDRLEKCGFHKDKKTLFILEGLTMYLRSEAMDLTFRTIQDYSVPGNKLIFDYIYASVIRKENLYDGEKEITQTVAEADEKFVFGIEKGMVGEFLSQYGFKTIECMDSKALEDRFFKDSNGKISGMVNGTHCIISALKE